MRDEKLIEIARHCGAKMREAHFEANMSKNVKKKNLMFGAVLEFEMFKKCTPLWREAWSQNVQSTPTWDHFWKLRCPTSALRCGGKHISKSKCEKGTRFGPLLDVQPHHATLQLQLQLQLRYNNNHSSRLHDTAPHYIQQLWVRWQLQPCQKAQPQPPFGPSVDSLCHPCVATTHSPSVQALKLPPPLCAVLLV